MFKNFRKNLSVRLMNKSDNFIIAARAIKLSNPDDANDDLNHIFNHLVLKALVYEICSKLLYRNN